MELAEMFMEQNSRPETEDRLFAAAVAYHHAAEAADQL